MAQISPGPLSRGHQQLEGVGKCASCHDFGAASRGFKCLDCHTEIRRRVEAGAGFHARAYKSAAGQKDCARCHMEHNGRNFAFVRLDRKAFDHTAQTGFALEGKHRELACERCHNERKLPASSRTELKTKDPNHTFLGLRRECLSCHEDQHRALLGAGCTRCHSQDAWKPTPGFSHSRSAFPLTGLHQTVACQKCHAPRAGEKTAVFKGLPYQNGCQSCHADPHKGAFQEVKFRGSCDSCHNTGGWKNNRPGSEFNHATTKFALAGKHAELACSKCHKTTDFHKPIAHQACRDCHEDPHKAQFASRAAGSDCGSCHNETGFKPARFDREMHRSSAFPLEGKHAAVKCADCHPPAGRETVYLTRKLVCNACHQDRHNGDFAAAPVANRCETCHTPAGYTPSSFTPERHAQTRFALTGKHAALACAACHKSGAAAHYRFAVQTCQGCHEDPHRTKEACETCHTTDAWKSVRTFNHASTRFALDGAHGNLKCAQCHVPQKTAPDFAALSRDCASCHAKNDAHGGQFHSAERTEDCAACHTATKWNTVSFQHDQARFPLDVAHRNVACVKCHKPDATAAAKPFRVYRGTPVECVQCH